jgi:hypothetical protein
MRWAICSPKFGLVGIEYFDRDGQPISEEQWGQLGGRENYRRVGLDYLTPDIHVSTIWLGLNHNWWGGIPLIYETMVFGGEHHGKQWRYWTEVEARAGHAAVVGMLVMDLEKLE